MAAPEHDTSIERAWRYYHAVEAILRSQSRRIGEVDATLGVAGVAELSFYLWAHHHVAEMRALASTHLVYPVVQPDFGLYALIISVVLALSAAVFLGGSESPDADVFLDALQVDEAEALAVATTSVCEDYARNRVIVRLKESLLALSTLLAALGMTIALLGTMVH